MPADLGQQLRDLQPRAESEHQEQERRQHPEVPGCAARHEHAARRLEPDFFAEHIHDQRPDRRHQRQDEQQLVHALEQRQREDVKADVAPEHRIRAAERRGVQEIQPRLPLGAGDERGEQGEHGRDAGRQPSDGACVYRQRLRPLRRRHHDDARPEDAEGQPQVAGEQREDGYG